MRVATSMIFDAGVSTMNKQMASLLHLQQQVSTGRRILTPADDPVGAARALEVTQSKNILEQYATNQQNATSALGLAEVQLNSINDLFGRIKELTVQAGNAALAASDRRSIAFELRARYDELLGIANAADGQGQYLFSGYMGSTKPFGGTVDQINAAPGNEIIYDGDDGQRTLQVSATRMLEVSDSGNDVFRRIQNGNGYFTTNYASANAGTGIIDGGSVTDPAKWDAATNSKNLEVRFWNDAVGQANGSVALTTPSLTITTGTNDEFTLAIDGGAAVTVTVGNNGGAAYATPQDLANAVQTAMNTALGATPPAAGSATVSVNAANQLVVISSTSGSTSGVTLAAVTGNTGYADMFGTPTYVSGHAGNDVTTYYDLVDVSTGFSLFTGTASTNGSGGSYTHVFESGQPISFSGLNAAYNPPSNDFGASVTISGEPASGDAFAIQASTSQSIFKTLANLINALETGNTGQPADAAKYSNEIGFALTNFSQANDNILRVRAMIGSRMAELESLGSVNEDLNLQYQQTLSNLQDLDYAKAISDLTRKQTDLQAAQQSFSRISQLTLFDYIR